MRLPRFNFASCVYNDKIYAFGGFTKDSVKTNYIEEFDINSKTWTKSAISLTEKSCAGYAFVYNKNRKFVALTLRYLLHWRGLEKKDYDYIYDRL